MALIQPSQSKTYANVEMKQGEDFELTLTMASPWTASQRSYQAKIVKDFSGTPFTGPKYADGDWGSVTITSSEFNSVTASGTDGGTIVIKMLGSKTQCFSDGFEGYWDLIEKDNSGNYVKQAQGEVSVDSTATPTF